MTLRAIRKRLSEHYSQWLRDLRPKLFDVKRNEIGQTDNFPQRASRDMLIFKQCRNKEKRKRLTYISVV